MIALPGRVYAQVIDGRLYWEFTQAQLPEWADDAFTAVDVTLMVPSPQVGDIYDPVTGTFSSPPPPVPVVSPFAQALINACNAGIASPPVQPAVKLVLAALKAYVQRNG